MTPRVLSPVLFALYCITWGCSASPTATDLAPQYGAQRPSPAAPSSAQPLPTEFSSSSRGGKYLVHWRPVQGELPLNESFELELELLTGAEPHQPITGAQIFVDAAMPEHNHGMLREPIAREVSPGVYRVEGMLLHMTGYWQVFVNVIESGVAETADFELTLE